jgi:CheY-like chemotaxis protein
MLIDDDHVDHVIYERIMKRSDVVGKHLAFHYADDALTYLLRDDREQIDLILLDINMPRMNGFEFLDAAVQQLGPDFAKCVVVMLTTSLNPSDQARAESYEVVRDFVNKPLTLARLEALARLIDQRDHI